jgi:hypothetical protein
VDLELEVTNTRTSPAGRKNRRTRETTQDQPASSQTRPATPAEIALTHTITAAAVVDKFSAHAGTVDVREVILGLADQVGEIRAGDLRQVESMLFGQAVALENIFVSLSRRAAIQELLPQYQAFLGLALKAQAQSRATLEALIEMKQPRPGAAFIKASGNVAVGGPQQVNTGALPTQSDPYFLGQYARAHAENSPSHNELLGVQDGERLDARATSQAVGADPHVEAVGTVDRAGN